MGATIIIPAHNEEAVIERTLSALCSGLGEDVQVLVVCNGCTDRTAELARQAAQRIEVLEIPVASKVAALNGGEAKAGGFPRLYLDADVSLSGADAMRIIAVLSKPEVLAAQPEVEYVLEDASLGVRAFYRVWLGLHGRQAGDLGTGIYCLSESGRSRFEAFPEIIADDGYVRAHFTPEELTPVEGVRTRVWAPQSTAGLVAARSRVRRGISELQSEFPELWSAKQRATTPLWRKALTLGPLQWICLPWYLYLQAKIRRAAAVGQGWARDDRR